MPKNVFGLTNNYKLEPKRNNLFTLSFDSIPNVGDTGDANLDGLQIDLMTAKRPTYTHNVVELRRFNMRYKVAQVPTMGDTMPITFRDSIQTNLGRLFYMWNKVIFNRQNGTMGYASAYKTDAFLDIFDPRGTVTERWRIKGMFPQETNWGELTYDDDGTPLTVALTFAYDVAWLDEGIEPASTDTQNWTQSTVSELGARGTTEDIDTPEQLPNEDTYVPVPKGTEPS